MILIVHERGTLMPLINEYHCTECEFSGPVGWGYYMYAEADDGERIQCSHPGERRAAERVIGEDVSEEEYDARTGFAYHCVCIDCLEQFDRNPNEDTLRCPNCRSSAVELLVELIGNRCPLCRDGLFVVEGTGAMA